ncbi:MAG: hypothetical protein HYW45_02355 [Candidatus Daviesbacteria bacterium]|nr:MAG: hypothetical protein HYW45_02355 [Candidatus Daviesbacteria bacterium]
MTSDKSYDISILPLVLTAQERVIMGASAPADTEADWYRPQGVLNQELSLEKVIEERGNLGNQVISEIMGLALGADKPIVLKLEDINPETGLTKSDPKIIGLWDKEKRTVVRAENGPELTLQVYESLQARGYDLHLRPQSRDVESGGLGGAEHE